MSDYDKQHTRRNPRTALDSTRRHEPVRPDDLELTRPAPRVERPPAPPPTEPAQLTRSIRRYERRRKRAGCLGCAFRVILASVVFVAASTTLAVILYVLAPPPRTNILLLGLDARPGEGMVTRTDTLILITVDPSQPYVGMLSIPRDLYIDIPGYGYNRINAAHVFGENGGKRQGPALVAQTIEANFGIPVHRVVRMNFEGFVAIIDAAGGVTIDVPYSFIDYEYPTSNYGIMTVSFDAGVQHMNGERALQYARIRHGSSDFERAARQQQVIEALARQLLTPSNWGHWPGVYAAYVQHVDSDLTILDMAALAPTVLMTGPSNIDRRVLDRGYVTGMQTAAGASVQQPQWDRINPLLDEMFFR